MISVREHGGKDHGAMSLDNFIQLVEKTYRTKFKNLKHKSRVIAIRRRRGRGPQRVIKEDQHKINDKILAGEVRLVGENVEMGVYPLAKAMELRGNLS